MPTLEWIGKQAVVKHHRDVPFHLLKVVDELSVGDKDSGNLLVQADNLLALKALLPYYAGKVKCIYIDPPYNTGEEKWVYNDNVNSPVIREWLGKVVGREFDDLSRHDKWLCMMYPRLLLLREFLTKDGSIWVSIDDNEIGNLRLLLDEIFGKNKFIATIAWQKRYSRENREAIGDVHEYIVVYANDPSLFKEVRNKVMPNEKQLKVYKNPNNDPRGRWRPIPITAQAGHATPDQFYEIVSPTGKKFKPSKGRCWGMSQETFERLNSEGKIYFGKKGNSQPNLIRYLDEIEGFVPWSWWPHEEVGHTDEAKKELYSILGKGAEFDTPKPVRLIERIVSIATNPGDIILDSFVGSGTTGHTLLNTNKVVHGLDRNFILVELDNYICETITKTRLERVIDGYEDMLSKDGTRIDGTGGSFSYCILGEKLFDERGKISSNISINTLASLVFFLETRVPFEKNEIKCPLIGIHNGTAIYLLFNGILGDKTVNGGNVLINPILESLPKHDGPKVIYGEACRLGQDKLRRLNIIFKQIPYDIGVK